MPSSAYTMEMIAFETFIRGAKPSRPDLQGDYRQSVFQVLDATSQARTENGLFCCGPTPVRLLNNTDVRIKEQKYLQLKTDQRVDAYETYAEWVDALKKRYPTTKFEAAGRPRPLPGDDTEFVKEMCKYFILADTELGVRSVETTFYTDGLEQQTNLMEITSTSM